MVFTTYEYAEAAAEANETGKTLEVVDGNLVFTDPPPPPAPESITMRQARLVLLQAGLLATVEAAIAAMPGLEGDAARIEWEYAASVERSNPLFASLGALLQLSEEDLDDLFRLAAGL